MATEPDPTPFVYPKLQLTLMGKLGLRNVELCCLGDIPFMFEEL